MVQNTKNTRPLLTPMDRKALSFARDSMRDDRIEVDKQNPPERRWSDEYEAAEKVFARILGEE